MTEVILKNQTPEGHSLEATFTPEKGMNLQSYKCNGIEIIDQSTRDLFEERYAGLGALIGPHFHHRAESIIPSVPNEEKFPHIARVKRKGVKEPFSHGIARYAAWQAEASEDRLTATLSGDDEWNGVALKDLEGQGFKIKLVAAMLPTGLNIRYSIASDTDSVLGFHYYYRLPGGKGRVIADVLPEYRENGELQALRKEWCPEKERQICIDLEQSADWGFRPSPSPVNGRIRLETAEYTLCTDYSCVNSENSWQLYHPEGASFVCIEPLSAMNPRRPRLSVSSIELNLGVTPA